MTAYLSSLDFRLVIALLCLALLAGALVIGIPLRFFVRQAARDSFEESMRELAGESVKPKKAA